MFRIILPSLIFIILSAIPVAAQGSLHSEYVQYELDGVVMQGYLVYDEGVESRRPGVLVVHEWNGIGDYVISRANQLAELGYIAFAADIYGVDTRPANMEESQVVSSAMLADRPLLRARANAALDVLKLQPMVDRDRVAAIGYCFGGTTVLELARSGADIRGIVSFHGGLSGASPDGMAQFTGKVLVCHGADDPYASPEDIAAFQDELRTSKVDWQMIFYGGAVHGFTNPSNGNDPSRGVAYNEDADKRSWKAMMDFFGEICY
jgi:dienelactone hydrolase